MFYMERTCNYWYTWPSYFNFSVIFFMKSMPWGGYKVHVETFWHIQMADYVGICKFFLRCNVFNTVSNMCLGDTGFMLKMQLIFICAYCQYQFNCFHC